MASAVNRDNALRPLFVLVGINTDKATLRFSMHLSIDRGKRLVKYRIRVEVDGMPRYAGDTFDLIIDKVDDYLSEELKRFDPDVRYNYRWDFGVEIGEVGFSKPLWHLAWKTAD